MFYNSYRTTKAALREAEKNKLAGVGQSIINPRERLLNLQKKEKLKDLLITKFMQKYGIKHPEKVLEDEISKFLQGEKLTDADLKRLDEKVKKLLKDKAEKDKIKSTLTRSMQDINPSANTQNPNIGQNSQSYRRTNLPNLDGGETINQKLDKTRGNSTQPKVISTAPNQDTLQPKAGFSNNLYRSTNLTRQFKRPEEELAELEAEFAAEEAKNKPTYQRLDFTNEGDEWGAMARYNRKIYEQQIQDEKIKDNEMKKRNREDLALQINQ